MWNDCILFILVYDVFLMILHMEQCFELYRALPTWNRGGDISHRGGQELTCQVCWLTDAVPCCLQGSVKSHPSCSQNSNSGLFRHEMEEVQTHVPFVHACLHTASWRSLWQLLLIICCKSAKTVQCKTQNYSGVREEEFQFIIFPYISHF